VKTRQTGLSYIEVLVATLLIAVALVPMMEALGPGLQGSEIHRERADRESAAGRRLHQAGHRVPQHRAGSAARRDQQDHLHSVIPAYTMPSHCSGPRKPVPHFSS